MAIRPTSTPTGPTRRGSLRMRMALLSGLSGVVFAVLLAAWVVRDQQARLADTVSAAVRREAHVAGQFITGLLADQQRQILQLAGLPELSNDIRDSGTIRLVMERVRSYHPEFEWLAVTDARGKVLTATGARLERADMSAAPWFVKAQAGPWISEPAPAGLLAPYLPPDHEGHPPLLVDLAAPVVDLDGQAVGVLVARMNWGWIVEQQARLSAHDAAARDNLLLGPQGEVWLGPPEAMGTRLRPVGGEAIVVGAAPQLLHWPDLGPRLSAAAPLPLKLGDAVYPGTLVVRQDPKVLLQRGELLGAKLLAVGLVAASLFMALSWWLAGYITRPLQSLASSAEALRRGGQASFVVPADQPSEIATLATSLDDLHTELQARLRELAAYRDHLEDKIRERTEELSQARDRAEAANRTKSAFIANMSHEIRTPMHAIMGATFLLQQSRLTADQPAQLQRIDQAAAHLLDIINAILDLSKIEAGMFELHPRVTHLPELLAKCLNMVSSRAHDKGLRLRLDAPDVPGWVMADEVRLSQVLINLLSNAVKFSDQGEVCLAVRTQPGAPEGQVALRLAVQDQGIGIAPEQHARVFNAFVQADESTTRRHGGTGLGLAISRSLVECMGGRIGVCSELGRGSEFWLTLTLPLADAPARSTVPAGQDATILATGRTSEVPSPAVVAVAPPSTEPLDALLAQLQARHTSRLVLVADDNLVNRELTSELLAMAGLRCVTAENGRLAIDVLQGPQGPDVTVVLMDVHMPGMDGMQATRLIRREERFASLPIIAMTASVLQQEQAECLDAGMNAHLPKPVNTRELFATLLHWLDQAA